MCLSAILFFVLALWAAHGGSGATVPWITYEAEAMTNNGTVLGPPPRAVDKNVTITNTVEMEASGRQCVKLSGTGKYVAFTAQAGANGLVVRYSVPDTANGTGADYTLSLYLNGVYTRKIPMTSKYSWLYGSYAFSNNPVDGQTRNYYDEVRLMNLAINAGDQVRLQVDADDGAAYYVIDLVDLENIAPPLSAPPGSRSVLSYGAAGNGTTDDTVAIRNCIAAGSGIIWFPPGQYLVTGDLNISSGITIQGAGMWHTTFVGSPATYVNERGRVRFNGAGNGLHFADFAIVGKLNNRNDAHANDGFSESFGTNSTIARVWVEHTKTGAWIINAKGMVISDCRFRNTIADGINLSVGVNSSVITNCTARNTGDDSFAIWPATYTAAAYPAGYNAITHCTAQTPFFANSCGIYGGISNKVEDCFFQDIPNGAGILIAGTFPVGTNIFRGVTAQRCDLNRCGGNDPGWRWRGALTLCPDSQTIAGLNANNINISNSLSYAVQILHNTMSNAVMRDINVRTYAVGVPPYHPQDPFPNNTNYCDGVFGVLADGTSTGSIGVSALSVNGTNIFAVQTNAYMTDCVNKAGGQFTFRFLTSKGVGLTLNNNGSVTLAYATVPGFDYHLEATTNLFPATWIKVANSETNSAGGTVEFTDSIPPGTGQRYYRSVSP